MNPRSRHAHATAVIGFVIAVCASLPAFAQTVDRAAVTRPWIAVALPASPDGDTRSAALAGAIAGTVELTLVLLDEYVVLPRDERPGVAVTSDDVGSYAEAIGADYVVFGSVSGRADGATEFSLSVYSRETREIVLRRDAIAATVFETFDVADELSIEILGAFTGQRIAFGAVSLENVGDPDARFAVFIDGRLVGRDVERVDRVLVGERRVEVVATAGPLAGRTIAVHQILVTERGTHRVEFAYIAPEPEPEPGVARDPVEEHAPERPAIPDEEAETPLAALPPGFAELDIVDLRVYDWHRRDRRDETVWSFSLLPGLDRRHDWASEPVIVSFAGRFDRAGRTRIGFGYERSFIARESEELDDAAFAPDAVFSYEPIEFTRVHLSYGLLNFVTPSFVVTPAVRVGIEREGREAVGSDVTGRVVRATEFVSGRFASGEMDEYFDESRAGMTTWSALPGVELTAEYFLRRTVFSAGVGAYRVVPFTETYDTQISLVDRETGIVETYPVFGSIEPGLGWYARFGIGYGWGGDENRIDGRLESPRAYEPLTVAMLTGRGWFLAPDLGASYAIGRDFAPRPLVAWPAFGLSALYSRVSGLTLGLGVFLGSSSNAFWYEGFEQREEHDEPVPVAGAIRTLPAVPGVRVAIGRRISVGEAVFLRPEYVFGAAYWYIDGGINRWYGTTGLRVTVENSRPGTDASVYSAFHVTTAIPQGPTDYSDGIGSHGPEQTRLFTPDPRAETPPVVGLDFGILFRLGGDPARLLADRDPEFRWLRYTHGADGSGAEPARTVPPVRFAVGTGFESIVAPDDDIAAAILVFPLTVRTRFGLTAGVQGSISASQDGGAGPIREFRVVSDGTSGDARLFAAPRLHRIFSLDLGYSFFRATRFSLTPAARITVADYEFLFIRTEIDGVPAESPGGHFSRADILLYVGGSLAFEFAATDRLTVRASASAQRSASAGRHEMTPVFSPTIEYSAPRYLLAAGFGVSVEL